MKRWFYTKVVKYRKAIMVAFVLLAICSAVMYPKVFVDYDIAHYLPEESPSTVALKVMQEEFGGNLPNTQVVIRDVSFNDAAAFRKKLEAIDGVMDVTWVDSMLPLNMPVEVLPEPLTEAYYKDRNAQFLVTVDESKQLETIPAIYDLIGEDNMLTGNSAITVVATVNSVREIVVITIIAILFLIFVLVITTTSWVEPIIILIGLLIAVVINSGTNLVFGKISFVTNAAGMILQMAVALDYSVFLIHRFNEREDDSDPEEAMVDALTSSSSSIMSSGLTTVIGFLALAFMRFLIGADLGLALSKGVAISLITTLVFMPGVILASYKWMERTSHRRFLPSFEKFGRFVLRVTTPLMIIFILAVVPSFIGSRSNDFWYGGSRIYGPETRIGSDGEKIREIFGDVDSYMLMLPRGDSSTQKALVRELQEIDKISNILGPEEVMGMSLPPEALPDSIINQLRTDRYDRMVLTVAVPAEGDETYALVQNIRKVSEKYYPGEYRFVGVGVTNADLKDVITGDTLKVNLIAIIAVFLVLLLTMRNIALPFILVTIIETAIWINMSISVLTGSHLFYMSYLIVSSVQLGATVDYAILFTQRYRENRNELGISPRESVVKTITENTVSIMTSALAVSVMGFLMAWFSTQGIIAQIGLLLGRGTLCSLFAVLFVLPGLLITFDRFVLHSFGGKKRELSEKQAL